MTIAELKRMLDQYGDDEAIWCIGTDSGGYDAMESPLIRVIKRLKRWEGDREPYLVLEGYEEGE